MEIKKEILNDNVCKNDIRKSYILKRKEWNKEIVSSRSMQICKNLISHNIFEQNHFFVYSAINGEVDLSLFIEECWKQKKNVYFPKVAGDEMDFYLVTSWNQLEEGAFHILEPKKGSQKILIDKGVILVPGVCFNYRGNRIGYGKGYYDRYLNRYPNLYSIGISYEWQIQNIDWQNEYTDISMKEIITEHGRVAINNEFE